MATSVVERLHEEFNALTGVLQQQAEISLQSTANDCFRKALLLAAASHFEVVVLGVINDFVSQCSGGNELVAEFVKQKALARQYHQLFDWDKNNANKFFALFGVRFKSQMEATLKTDAELDDAIKAFLEVGRERNRLVHQDFGNFVLEKTAQEIYGLFIRAIGFTNRLPELLAACPSN